MSARGELVYLSDNPLRVKGPTSYVDASSTSAISSITSCTARLYDESKTQPMTTAAAATDTALEVFSTDRFAVGDTINVRLEDGTLHEADIDTDGIDASASTITIDTAIPASRSVPVGYEVRVKLGADVTVETQYGTPAADDETWGFYGVMADTHADIEPGQDVLVEYEFNGGAGLQKTIEYRCRVVKGSG